MLWEIIKKQAKIFMRDPQQLFLLLMLPIILISILSASLSGFISGETVKIEAKVAVVEHENEREQIDRFIDEVTESNFSEEERSKFITIAEQFSIINLLKTEVFNEVSDLIELVAISPEEKEVAVESDVYTAVIEFPNQFTYDSLKNMLLHEGTAGELKLYLNEGKEIGAAAVKTVIDSFQEQISTSAFLIENQIDPAVLEVATTDGQVSSIGQSDPITSKEYYTIGMAVMNVLYIATAIGSFAFLEKESQVFNRVILANMSRWTYFSGIFLSGTIFGMIQLCIIFGFSWVIYGVTWPIIPFFTITLCLSLAVGGLSSLLTAFSFNIHSESVINFFSTFFIALLALLGGSFFPIGEISNVIQWIGDFTPNGASMSAYLSLLRGDKFSEIIPHLVFLLLFTAVILMAAIYSYPKRGQI